MMNDTEKRIAIELKFMAIALELKNLTDEFTALHKLLDLKEKE